MTIPCRNAALLSALVLVSTAMPAQAAESYDNCAGTIASLPTTITTQGVWCLKGDLATNLASGAAIIVDTNNVTIDCNDFKLGGLGAGDGTGTVGIRVTSKLNTVVRNCNIRGFAVGIKASLGGGFLVEDNRIEGSTMKGIEIHGGGSTVRRNLVSDTGGSTVPEVAFGVGIHVEEGVDVIDNTVTSVTPGIAGGGVAGILSVQNPGATIVGNRVTRLAPSGVGVAFGIDEQSNGAIVAGNHLTGPGLATGYGVNCSALGTTATRNVVRGFPTAVNPACYAVDNLLNTN
jgi:hypothetical protein